MTGKKLIKMCLVGVLAVCFLLQIKMAEGDDRTDRPAREKRSVPLAIMLYFSSVPMLNEHTVLNVEINVLRDAPNTRIDIELPQEGFRRISGNTQMVEDLSSGSTTIYQIEVLPTALGQYKISASAVSESPGYTFGKKENLYVIIGEEFSQLSKNNIITEAADSRSEAMRTGNFSVPPAQKLSDQELLEGQGFSFLAAPGVDQIVVKGYLHYQDRSGVDRPLRDARVEIWDADSSNDTFLDVTYTDNSGYYESENLSNIDDEGGGQDIYVKVFSTDDRSVRVTDFSTPANLYYFVTPVVNDVADGEIDMGVYSIDDAVNRMAWYIYDLISNVAFDYLAVHAGWQNVYKLQVRWSPTNDTDGTHYHPGKSIDLLAADRWDSDVLLHEYAHFVMYKIYGDYLPPAPNCYDHYWGKDSSLGCAWIEGWATFLQAAIQNDQYYEDTEDQTLRINLEPPAPSADHAEDEGAVAASFWDIFDPVSTLESWDDIANGINGSSNNGIWSIVYNDGPADFLEFYSNWANSSNGYNSEIIAILQHHQINPDVTPPTVAITAPTGAAVYSTDNSLLNIGGTASDNVTVSSVTWSNSRGGSGACSGTTSWSKSGITLLSGQNVITVTATDAVGNTATDTLTVTYTPPDTTKPTIAISSPTGAAAYSTASSQLSIGGTASDDRAVSSVTWSNSRGGSGVCSGTTSWSESGITLLSGQNVITVTARDAAGNWATDTLTVTYTPPDTTKPTIAISSPTGAAAYSTTSSQLSIGGTASDDRAVSSVTWSNSRGGSGVCSGTTSWSESGITLLSGQNVITVTARDAAGNWATDTLTVTYTPPDTTKPTIAISSPTGAAAYSTTSSQLNIDGSASDDRAVSSVTWSNSRGGSGACSGTTSWSKTGITLLSGQNVITVTATDVAGNSATDTLTVTYTPPDTTSPTVAFTAPTGASTFATGTSPLNIGGTASDNVAVASVAWSNSRGGSGNCSGTVNWSSTGIALSSGQNVITVTAMDAVGNTAADTLTVTYTPPSTPPEIVEEDSYPHDAQGIDDGTLRVSIDSSIVARIKDENGVDVDSVELRIEDQPVEIRLQQVNEGDDSDYWIIHTPETPFAFEQEVNIAIDARNQIGLEMETYYSSFKTESKNAHDTALANTPPSTSYFDDPVIGKNAVVADPATVIEGAEIIYDGLEPVAPRFGPLDELPDLDIVNGVGVPLNMQPGNVFVNPVTVFIPCPGETDLGTLEIYIFNPSVGWQASWETDGCIVPGSRVNHGPDDPNPTDPPTIEIQLNHFTGVQAGRSLEPIQPSAGAGDDALAAEGGGGGGGCFITASAGKSQKIELNLSTIMLLITLGLAGIIGIRRKLKK